MTYSETAITEALRVTESGETRGPVATYRIEIIDGEITDQSIKKIMDGLRKKENKVFRELINMLDHRSVETDDQPFDKKTDKLHFLIEKGMSFGLIEPTKPFELRILIDVMDAIRK